MLSERKIINMGDESPKVSLPEPVQWNEDAAPDIGGRPSGTSDDVSVLTTFTKQSSVEEQFGDRIVPVPHDRYARGLNRSGAGDDVTVFSAQSDLNSNAFYWESSPLLVTSDYSASLEKNLCKKAPRLVEHIHALHVKDPSIILAVKELVCSNEKVSTILKRMHEGVRKTMAQMTDSTSLNVHTGLESFVDIKFHSNDVQDIAMLSANQGYLWRKGELYTYDIPPFLEYMRVDFEHAKIGAIHQLLQDSIQEKNDKYTILREAFRALVTSDRYQESPGDDDDVSLYVEPRLPAQWLADNVRSNVHSRFNVQAFIKDSKIGQFEKQVRYFTLDAPAKAFMKSLDEMVTPTETAIRELSRLAVFDIKRTDDVIRRFHKYTTDYSLIFNVLSVLMSHHCVLVRYYLNHAYPNLAIFLHVMEHLEHGRLYRVMSPFFPPRSRNVVEKQLTDLGFVEDSVLRLTQVYVIPKPVQRFFLRTPVTPPPPPSPPLPPPSPPARPPSPPSAPLSPELSMVDESQLTFSTMFKNIFKR